MDDSSSDEIPLEPLPGEEDEELSSPALAPAKTPKPGEAWIDEEEHEEAAPRPAAKAGYLPRIKDYENTPAPQVEADPKAKKEKKAKPAARDRDEPRKKAASKPIDRGTEAPRRISEARPGAVSKPRPKGDGDGGPEKKGALVEATPELDTYESRQRMRLFIGGGIVVVLLVIGIFIWHAASGGSRPAEENVADVPAQPVQPVPANSPEKEEVEARLIYDDAHSLARRKNVKRATELLNSIVANHPHTPTADLAREALDRPKKSLPLFLDVPAVIAEETKTQPPPEPPKAEEVVATTPPGPAGGSAVVGVVPPPTPPEPRRDTGLVMEDAKVAPKPLPAGFRARPEVGVNAQGWPWEITCDKDGTAMVLIPGGEFVMGSDKGPTNERPARKVTLGAYYIDQHEVTVGQYMAYLKDSGTKPPFAMEGLTATPDLPMIKLTAREAVAYNQWTGKELPTEAQWEMAGRATDARIHPWGNAPAEWVKPRTFKQIDPVASFPGDLSPYGVFDLAGNASEWTNDYYNADAAAPPPAKAKAKSSQVTIKGGSKDWLLAWRQGQPIITRSPTIGFRGVLSVESSPAPAPGQPANPGVVRPGGSPF